MNRTQNLMSLLGGALVGATAMYLLDPEMGRKRRRYIAEQAGDYLEDAGEVLQSGWEKVSDRARDVGAALTEKAQDYGQQLSDLAEEYSGRLSKEARSSGSSWGDTAKGWMSGLAGRAGKMRSRGGKLFSRYGDRAQERAADYASRAEGVADDITDYGNELWEKVKNLGSRVTGTARDARKRARYALSDLRGEHSAALPITATAVGCAALGIGLMYLMDPRLGRSRRSWLADKVTSTFRRTGRTFYRTGKDLANRGYGMAAETRSRFQSGPVSGEQLLQRVRSEMGRVCSQPGLIQVLADDNGSVTLSGFVLADESDNLIAAVEDVPGVNLIINRLEMENSPQDLNRRRSTQSNIPQM